MAMELLPFVALNLAMILYVLTAAVDFGGGVLYVTAPERSRVEVREAILAYAGPVWETTNVFLILYVVGLVGFFPGAISTLVPPLFPWAFLAIALLFVRGAIFGYHYQGGTRSEALNVVSGVAGALVPAILVGYVAVVVTGRAPFTAGNTLVMIAFSLLALASIAYVAATFFAWYASHARNAGTGGKFAAVGRRYGTFSGALALVVIAALAIEAPGYFGRLIGASPLLLVAAAFAVAAWQLSRRRRLGLATLAVVGQYVFGIVAIGAALYPYIIYPSLPAAQALTGPAMYTALVITLFAGLAVVVPLLGLLYYLFAFRFPAERSDHGGSAAY